MEYLKNEIALQIEKLGLAAQLISLHRQAGAMSLNVFVESISPAIKHKQIRFVFDSNGLPIGFWIWAMISEETHQRLHARKVPFLHPSEWQEGNIPWVLYLASRNGHARDIITHIRDIFFQASEIFSMSRRSSTKEACVISWRRRFRHISKSSDSDLFFRLPRNAYASSLSEWLNQKEAINLKILADN